MAIEGLSVGRDMADVMEGAGEEGGKLVTQVASAAQMFVELLDVRVSHVFVAV